MSKNYVIYDADPQRLNRLAEEYRWLGREVDQDLDKITVLAMPRTWKRKQKKERRLRAADRDWEQERDML